MTGEAHHVDAHGLHVDVEHSRRLGGVHHQQQAVLLGKAPDGPDIQQIPRQVGAVGADDTTCVGPQQAAEVVVVDAALPVRRQEVHLHLLQPVQGTQNGIVLAVSGQHMVTGANSPPIAIFSASVELQVNTTRSAAEQPSSRASCSRVR